MVDDELDVTDVHAQWTTRKFVDGAEFKISLLMAVCIMSPGFKKERKKLAKL